MASAKMVQQIFRRQMAAAAKDQPSAEFFKLKKKQEAFQLPDGKPVFLKGGVGDKIMYQFTMFACLVGAGLTTKLFYDLSVPKK